MRAYLHLYPRASARFYSIIFVSIIHSVVCASVCSSARNVSMTINRTRAEECRRPRRFRLPARPRVGVRCMYTGCFQNDLSDFGMGCVNIVPVVCGKRSADHLKGGVIEFLPIAGESRQSAPVWHGLIIIIVVIEMPTECVCVCSALKSASLLWRCSVIFDESSTLTYESYRVYSYKTNNQILRWIRFLKPDAPFRNILYIIISALEPRWQWTSTAWK